jgi:hypothetical protein
MKKVFLALMCMATMTMFIGCGGRSKKADSAQKAEEAVEKLVETGAFGERTKAATQAAFKGIGLTLGQVEPDYKYIDEDTLKIYRGVVYQGRYEGSAVFIKTDNTDVSREEFESYVRKIYAVTQKIADEGKVINGFERKSKPEEAVMEWAVDDILAQKILGFPLSEYNWGFRYKDKYKRMEVGLLEANKKYPARLQVHFYDALQKSMDETMKDAEKALKDPKVQKALEDAFKK